MYPCPRGPTSTPLVNPVAGTVQFSCELVMANACRLFNVDYGAQAYLSLEPSSYRAGPTPISGYASPQPWVEQGFYGAEGDWLRLICIKRQQPGVSMEVDRTCWNSSAYLNE